MLSLRVSNDIQINLDTLPQTIKRTITRDLTVENPAYVNAKRMDKYTGNIEKYIYLYEPRGDTLILPRGYIYRLLRLLKDTKQEYEIDDQRLLLNPVDFYSTIELRPPQARAASQLFKFGTGGLVAGCGFGKTETELYVMAQFQQPALWITHSYELLDQLIERASRCFRGITREEIGVIAGGQIRVGKRLTVGLIQTLNKVDLTGITNQFGSVFVDEAHRLGSDSMYNVVNQFPAKYRMWCSATPERPDGLIKMIFAVGGPVLHTVKDAELITIKPRLQIIETTYSGFCDATDFPRMMAELVNNAARNELIADIVAKEAPGHYSLVLSDRISHLETLKTIFLDRLPGLTIELLNGHLPKKERTAIMERCNSRQVDILLATQLAREGLDLPHLDRLFLVSPKKAGGATEQEIGRIRRPCTNKLDAVVFDFWDTQNPIFKSQFWKRRAVYQKLGIAVDFQSGMQRIPV